MDKKQKQLMKKKKRFIKRKIKGIEKLLRRQYRINREILTIKSMQSNVYIDDLHNKHHRLQQELANIMVILNN